MSSEYELLRKFSPLPSKRIIVLNKMELADPLELKKCIDYFEERNYLSYAVNSHNKDCVKQVTFYPIVVSIFIFRFFLLYGERNLRRLFLCSVTELFAESS